MMKSLEKKKWKPLEIQDVFTIGSGVRLESRNRTSGSRPFIGALDNSNGIVQFVDDINASLDSNVLGVNYNGNGMGIGFYHPYECIFSDDVKRFHLKDTDDTTETLLFSKTLIEKQRSKFGYLYKFNAKRMAATSIMLPVLESGMPDYEFMSEYVRTNRKKLLTKYRIYIEKRIDELGECVKISALSEKKWQKFKAFGDDGLFCIATTNSSIDSIRLIDGDNKKLPYVTRTDSGNGIVRYVSCKNMVYGYDEAGCITVGLDTQTAFWQPYRFVTGQNIQIITSNELNEYIAQFIIPLLRNQMRAKFNWGGNRATLGRMKTLELMLPVTDSGNPDYNYMEQYVKNLMLRKYKQYLVFIDSKEKQPERGEP